MRFTDILGVIGGLSLFLYGMKMMSDGLALVAGSRLKEILEKLTRNRYWWESSSPPLFKAPTPQR